MGTQTWHAAARAVEMLGGVFIHSGQMLRRGHRLSVRRGVLCIVGDGLVAGHRQRIVDAPDLWAVAGWLAAARAAAMLSCIQIHPGQSARSGYWSRIRPGILRGAGDGSLRVQHRRFADGGAPRL